MKKIHIIVADEDDIYLKQLTGYFVKSTRSFEVSSFNQQESLARFLERGEEKVDILMLSESMRCAASDACAASVKLLLSEGEQGESDGYSVIQKYQKTADLVNDAMLLYGKASGQADRLVHGDRKSQFIGVYSPVGGSGKTTVALLLACELAAEKKKTFFMNCEHVDSTRGILPALAKISLSELLVAVHSGESGVGLNLFAKMYTHQKLGFSYVNPLDSSLEWGEIPVEERVLFLKELEKTKQFDNVVLDFDSELNMDKLRLLQMCDQIVVPFLPDAISLNKLIQFFREMKLREELAEMSDRFTYVGNRMAPGMENYLRQCGLYEHCVPALLLPASEQAANLGAVLQRDVPDTAVIRDLTQRLLKA